MSWYVPAFELWFQVTLAGFALTAIASLAVLLIRQPARKIRIVQLALVGLLVLPALALLPGYPRVAWWPAVANRESAATQTKNPPAKPGAIPTSVPRRVQPPALPGGSSAAPNPTRIARPTGTEPASPSLPGGSSAVSVPARIARPSATQLPSPARLGSPAATSIPARIAPASKTESLPPAQRTSHKRATAALPSLPDYRLLVISAYFAGVALFAAWWLIGRFALWRLLRTAMPAEPDVRTLFEEVAAGSDRGPSAARVRLLVSSRAAQPCAFGWLRPTIVLPECVVKELTREQLRLALSHEWSHVARGDIRTWMLAGLVRLVHFYQPLLWLLRRELRVSQDYLADAAAAGVATPEDYAELLTTLSQMLRPTSLSPGLGIAPRRSDLYRRVVMLVDPSRPLERTIPRRWNLAAGILGIALVAGVATLRAEPEADQPPAASQSPPSPVGQPNEVEPVSSASTTPAAPSAARRKTRQELQDDPTDRRDIALELVTVGTKLESLLKTRKMLQLRLSSGDLKPEERLQIERSLAAVDDAIAETSQRFVEIQEHFGAASLKEHARVQAAAADWEQSGDKRRMLESLWAALDRLLELRDATLKQAAEQKSSRERAPLEAHIASIDAARAEIAQRIEELLKPDASALPQEPGKQDDSTSATPNNSTASPIPQTGLLSPELIQEFNKLAALRKALQQHAARPLDQADKERLEARLQEVDERARELAIELKRFDTQRRNESLHTLLEGDLKQAVNALSVRAAPPFSGKIRPGDILGIELVGGFPTPLAPTRTVEPDGNLALDPKYGPASRVKVAGMTLIEAGQEIEKQLKAILRDPHVLLTYQGHDAGVVATAAPQEPAAASLQPTPAAESVVLQPLDTIEIIAPIKPRVRIAEQEGKPVEVSGDIPNLSGTYLIEPDGRVALLHAGGRVKLGGLTEAEASEALRKHLSENFSTRTALPTTRVLRRGRAIFAEGSEPPADYTIAPGDKLLLGDWPGNLFTHTVDSDGNLGSKQKVYVAGLTLEEAQQAARKNWTSASEFALSGRAPERAVPWVLTLGGWREEADPRVIDLIEGTDATQLLRMQEEMEELKSMIQRLQAK